MVLVALGEPEGRDAWTVHAGDGRAFAVFVLSDGYRVSDALCPHNGGPLAQGRLFDGGQVVCPWHWYRFDLETGACATVSQYRLAIYPVIVRGGVRYADVGEPPATRSWSDRLRAHARGDVQ